MFLAGGRGGLVVGVLVGVARVPLRGLRTRFVAAVGRGVLRTGLGGAVSGFHGLFGALGGPGGAEASPRPGEGCEAVAKELSP